MPLRTLTARLVFAGAALLATGGRLHAQPGFTVTITVNEDGIGRFQNSAGFDQALHGVMAPDPGPGGLSSVLTYDLLNPPGLVAGDLLLTEGVGGPVYDVVRFNPGTTSIPDAAVRNGLGPLDFTGGTLAFYSDDIGGVDNLADTFGPPTAFYPNTFTLPEVGPEGGPNGVTYTPLAGQPGFVAGAAGPVTYIIQSDTVPEPTTWALLGAGLAGLAVVAVRRRTATA